MKFKYLLKVGFMFLILLFASYAYSQTEPADSDITANVKVKIATDSFLSGANINVSTTNGVVALTGNVDSDSQASAATELAQSITGVKDVDISKLTVRGSQHPVVDAIITAKVKGMFIQQKLFGDKDVAPITIQVETNNGIVSLTGTADNQEQADNAVKIAKAVSGVKEVKSNVTIATPKETPKEETPKETPIQ